MSLDRRQIFSLVLTAGLAASVAFGLGVVAQENWQGGGPAAASHVSLRDAGFVADSYTSRPAISPPAEELLRAAATDNLGQVYVIDTAALYEGKGQRTPRSTLHIRSADREFCVENSPRSKARWRAVIAELAHVGYLEPAAADPSRATYRVTLAGYEAADKLLAPAASPR